MSSFNKGETVTTQQCPGVLSQCSGSKYSVLIDKFPDALILNTFIPIYWISYLHQSKMMGSLALTTFAASGILGNLIGGSLADKYGPKKILLFGFLGLAVLLPIFCMVDIAPISLLLMFPIGLILYASYGPSIVLGQNYLPNRVGLSSGITLGIAISIGSAATPIIGKIADIYGVWSGIVAIACLPMLIFAVAFGLPATHSDDEQQKIIQPQDRRKSYYDKQERTIGSSLDRDLLTLKLMSKRYAVLAFSATFQCL